MVGFGKVEPAQAVFRCLAAAMSHPGRRFLIPRDKEPGTSSAVVPMLQVAQTLLDHEVGFHVIAPGLNDRFSDAIFARTKANRSSLETADFIFVDGGGSNGAVARARRGTLPYPDRSATVIYCLDAAEQSGRSPAEPDASLQGPGIDGVIRPEVLGLSAAELECIKQINDGFPQGVDVLVLRAPDRVMAIARSTRISLE